MTARRVRFLVGPLVAAVLLGVLTGCAREPTGGEWALVVGVIDGDTIELDDGRRVRYIGINTPERGQPGADSATALNERLVMGRRVRLEYGHERLDRYGRTLAAIFVDDLMVGRELVRAGWASCYFFRDNLIYAAELLRVQQEAMTAHRGLWGLRRDDSAGHYVASFSSFRFHRDECPSVKRIPLDQEIVFRHRDSAYFYGYSPCGACNP